MCAVVFDRLKIFFVHERTQAIVERVRLGSHLCAQPLTRSPGGEREYCPQTPQAGWNMKPSWPCGSIAQKFYQNDSTFLDPLVNLSVLISIHLVTVAFGKLKSASIEPRARGTAILYCAFEIRSACSLLSDSADASVCECECTLRNGVYCNARSAFLTFKSMNPCKFLLHCAS